MKKSLYALILACFVSFFIGCVPGGRCGIDWDPKTLAESINVPLYVQFEVFEDGQLVYESEGSIGIDILTGTSITLELYDDYRPSTVPPGSTIREPFPLFKVSPVYLTGELKRVSVSYDAPIDFLFDDIIYRDTQLKIDGYIGYSVAAATRCSPIFPGEGYVVDLSFEFERPGDNLDDDPVSVKCVVSRQPYSY